jgi:hypothetical protein
LVLQLGGVVLRFQTLPFEGYKLDKKQSWNVAYWLLAFLLLLWMQGLWQNANQSEVVPYSVFEQALREGRIADVVVRDLTMTGRLKAAEGQKNVLVTARVEPDLAARLDKYDVPSWILPALVFFGLWFFLFRSFADKQGLGGHDEKSRRGISCCRKWPALTGPLRCWGAIGRCLSVQRVCCWKKKRSTKRLSGCWPWTCSGAMARGQAHDAAGHGPGLAGLCIWALGQ